jgi:hypothetical protein
MGFQRRREAESLLKSAATECWDGEEFRIAMQSRPWRAVACKGKMAFSEVIGTCGSGLGAEDLRSGESFDHVHGPWQRGHGQVAGCLEDDASVAGGD